MAHTPLSSNTHDGGHHITQPFEYIKVLVALAALMLLTMAFGIWIPPIGDIFGIERSGVWMNNIIAIVIAVVKAILVIMVFMGVKHSSSLTKIWVVAGFICFSLMYFIMADNLSRTYEPAPSWIEGKEDGPALPRTVDPLSQELPPDEEVNVRPRQ